MDDNAPPRLTSAMLVSAMIRRVQAAGGFAVVVHRGDAQAGAILVECADRGQRHILLERTTSMDGADNWRIADDDVAADAAAHDRRIERRRASDADLWVIELDIADAARIATETIGVS